MDSVTTVYEMVIHCNLEQYSVWFINRDDRVFFIKRVVRGMIFRHP